MFTIRRPIPPSSLLLYILYPLPSLSPGSLLPKHTPHPTASLCPFLLLLLPLTRQQQQQRLLLLPLLLIRIIRNINQPNIPTYLPTNLPYLQYNIPDPNYIFTYTCTHPRYAGPPPKLVAVANNNNNSTLIIKSKRKRKKKVCHVIHYPHTLPNQAD